MMIIGNAVHARIRRLRDNTERQLTEVFDLLEETSAIGPAAAKQAAPVVQPKKPSPAGR